jgi:N-acetylglucosaminyl-diphospho-decaprenol L-rhamnosyltransferase
MPDPALALILVTHNSAHWLPAFFRTWREAAAASTLAIDILLADAGSTDDTLRIAMNCEPTVRILECGNIGYGAAANRAAARSPAPWRLVCNPDLLFHRNFFAAFIEPALRANEPTSGCIAPKLTNPDGSPQPSIGQFPTIRHLLLDQFRPPLHRKFLPLHRLTEGVHDWAAGACLLCSRTAWESVQGFDENFFLYVEEVDFQRRLAARGFLTRYVSTAEVIHAAPNAGGPPRPLIQKYAARGLLRYFAKHGTLPQLTAYRLLALLSRRLPPNEALAPKQKILTTPTGP